MAFARDVYTATASQTDFTISYPYKDDDHIEVYQNGSLLTETTHYTFPNSTTCRLVTGATEGDTIVLQRNTSQSTKLVDFTAGTLTETDLDDAFDQMFYMAQESQDQIDLYLGKDGSELWDAESIRIKNVGTPNETTDAVTKAYADAIAAAAGNVTTPGNPADDNKALVASAGTWTWTALTGATHVSVAAADITDGDTTGVSLLQAGTAAAALAIVTPLTTRGDICFHNGAATTRLPMGTVGQVVGSDGTDVVWLNGLWEDVSDTTLTGDTEVEWTVDDGYIYQVIATNVAPSGSSYPHWLEKTAGAYVTTSGYTYSWYFISSTAGSDATADNGFIHITSTDNHYYELTIYNAGSASERTVAYGRSRGTTSLATITYACRNAATAATNLKILLSASATMDSGRIIVRRQKEVN